ncbi:unnamed protein product [Ilex paraguariensis]|uniref:Uncharacterized protein n=1 Tax=Ilex paraguariensis TaxID=185542 RepID=A0ABC8THK4_9AQUA
MALVQSSSNQTTFPAINAGDLNVEGKAVNATKTHTEESNTCSEPGVVEVQGGNKPTSSDLIYTKETQISCSNEEGVIHLNEAEITRAINPQPCTNPKAQQVSSANHNPDNLRAKGKPPAPNDNQMVRTEWKQKQKIQETTNGKDVDPAPIDKGKNIVSTVIIDPPYGDSQYTKRAVAYNCS